MPTRYHITPYDPKAWHPDFEDDPKPSSDLHIFFSDFMRQARLVWPDMGVHPPRGWVIYYNQEAGVSGSFSGDLFQILTIEGVDRGFAEFVVWYRTYIPSQYPLFLFEEGDWDRLELTSKIAEADIISFLGIDS